MKDKNYEIDLSNRRKLKTKWGNAIIDKDRYRISNGKYRGKLLHKLIFEDFYGPIPDGCHIHHKDENPLNNCILNLQLMTSSAHSKYHSKNTKGIEKAIINNRKHFYKIIKNGKQPTKNKLKQNYALYTPYPSKKIKQSVDINKLINYCELNGLNYEVNV